MEMEGSGQHLYMGISPGTNERVKMHGAWADELA
jgi:hypothetical protein